MDLVLFIGALIGLGAVIWGILAYEENALDEGIRQAQEWDSKQKKMQQALERK